MNTGGLNMKNVDMQRLLEKYYEGLTSEAEEQVLLDYLLSEDLPAEFEADREVLCSLLRMSEEHKPSPGFEQVIISKISSDGKSARRGYIKQLYWSLSGIAATLIAALSIWFLAGNANEPADTFSSPELAYAETVRALHMLSSEMNRGTSALSGLESINRAADEMSTVEATGRLMRKGFNLVEDIYDRLGLDIDEKK
jgi:hypothetical protein